MNITFKLDLNQSQTVSLNTIQIMSLLQMNVTELSAYINEALLENPALEAYENHASSSAFEYNYRSGRSSAVRSDADDEIDPINIYGSSTDVISLYDALFWQLDDISSPYTELARKLACCLDSNGYLAESDFMAVAAEYGNDAIEARSLLQSLTPAGVGAADLRERLLLQLRRQENRSELAEKIIADYFDDVAQKKYARIAKREGVSIDEVYSAMEHIKMLDPFPIDEFKPETRPQYIVPDIILNDAGELSFSDSCCPELRVDSYYANMLSETDDPEVKEYLNNKIKQANWVINCINQRRNIIIQSMLAIIERQEDFFSSSGKAPLKPLTQKEIAEKTGVNVSTISRAISGKYIQCPYGSYPLSYFICTAVGDSEDGNDVSSRQIQARIKELIDAEAAQHPLSDQKLADMLASEGMNVSRRTIAKYRSILNIPGTSVRKSSKMMDEKLNKNK